MYAGQNSHLMLFLSKSRQAHSKKLGETKKGNRMNTTDNSCFDMTLQPDIITKLDSALWCSLSHLPFEKNYFHVAEVAMIS